MQAINRGRRSRPSFAHRGHGTDVRPADEPTEWEEITSGMKEYEILSSAWAREWAKRHRHKRYIPEHLLVAWKFEVGE